MLLVLEMSKLLLTVKAMLVDTVPFMLLTMLYLYIMASFLYTLYGDINPEKYGTFLDTLITIFDDLMGSYGYGGFGAESEMTHTLWLIATVYGANILFLNYLVAILSESYATMLDNGLFLYKVLLYQYCERYLVAFKSGPYGELIKHPAPACLLNFPLVLLSLVPAGESYRRFLERGNVLFSKLMFWLENIFWIFVFLAYSLLLVPFVYLSNFYNILWATSGPFLPIFYSLFWLVGGLFFCLFIVLRDVWLFMTLLSVLEGCRERSGKEDAS